MIIELAAENTHLLKLRERTLKESIGRADCPGILLDRAGKSGKILPYVIGK